MKIITLLLISFFAISQTKMERVSLPGNKASLLAPVELTRMTDQVWASKYQKRVRPAMVLTDKTGEVNLIGDLTEQKVAEEQLLAFKDFQVAQLTKNKTESKVLGDGIRNINGKKVGYYKFVTTSGGQKIFNYYFFTIVDQKILFFTFNCVQKLQAAWEKTADQMMASLKTK